MFAEYLRISLRSLTKRKLRSWLTMIGIIIGIAAVVSLIGLGEGLRNAVIGQFNLLGADFITVQAGGLQFGPPGSGVVTPLSVDNIKGIDKIVGVKFAIGRLIKSVKVEIDDKIEFNIVGSIPDGRDRDEVENILGLKASKGRLLKDGDGKKVVLGSHLIDEGHIGEKIRVGSKILIDDKKFDVIGIPKTTGSFIVDGIILMNENVLRDLLNEKEEVSAILVKVQEGSDINLVKESISRFLLRERNVKEGEENFRVEIAVDSLKALDSTLFAVQLFVYIIASMSLIVGGIGIMNTMYTSVVERIREIGVLKSIGARNQDIFMLFLIESGLLGFVGGMVGIATGVTMAKGLAYIASLQLGSDLIQANISAGLVMGALAFSFLIGSIAGITPAMQASKLSPVEALRK